MKICCVPWSLRVPLCSALRTTLSVIWTPKGIDSMRGVRDAGDLEKDELWSTSLGR